MTEMPSIINGLGIWVILLRPSSFNLISLHVCSKRPNQLTFIRCVHLFNSIASGFDAFYDAFMCISMDDIHGSVHRSLSYEEKIERLQNKQQWKCGLQFRLYKMQILWNLRNFCDQVEWDDTIFNSKKVFLYLHKEAKSLKFVCEIENSVVYLWWLFRTIDPMETFLAS